MQSPYDLGRHVYQPNFDSHVVTFLRRPPTYLGNSTQRTDMEPNELDSSIQPVCLGFGSARCHPSL